jgi:hypothetical protein
MEPHSMDTLAKPLAKSPADPEQDGVVWPLGARQRPPRARYAARLGDLNGKTLAEVWSWMWGGDTAFAVLREQLRRRYPDLKIVPYTEFGNIHGPDENNVVAGLPAALKKHGVDGVILGIANCGSCTPAVLRAHLACERAGFPSVSIVGEPFYEQATAVADHLGAVNAAMAIYPGNIEADSKETFRTKCGAHLPDAIVTGLTAGKIGAGDYDAEPSPRSIVFRGSLDEVLEHFERNQWTDGLPIVPPTLARVQAFMEFSTRPAQDVLGVLLPAQREATVWNVAVHGVMAGCRPEYMPILLAAVEAICDPKFRLEDQGVAPAWEILCTVSGPIATQLGFNHAHGVLSSGCRANTSVGRFLRLYSRNIAGHRIAPGVTDYAGIGNNFGIAMAENEEVVREIGWPTYGEERGAAPGENVVTVQSIVAASPSFLYAGADHGNVPDYIWPLKEVFGDANCGYWAFTGASYGQWHPLLVINPDMARLIAKAGWDKPALRRYLYENCRIRAGELERRGELMNLNLKRQVENGVLPAAYHESDDPDRLVPIFVRPEWISIVVAGAPTTFFRGYMNNHEQGVPTTRPVRLPDHWQRRVPQ